MVLFSRSLTKLNAKNYLLKVTCWRWFMLRCSVSHTLLNVIKWKPYDESFRDLYVQWKVKTLINHFWNLKKKTDSWKAKWSPCENHVIHIAGVFFEVQISRRLCAVGASPCRRSFALHFSSSKPRCHHMVDVYDDWAVWKLEWRRSPALLPPRPQLNDFPAAALTRPREQLPGPNWLDSMPLMVPRANVVKNSTELRITACHLASYGGKPDSWQWAGDSSRWLKMIFFFK